MQYTILKWESTQWQWYRFILQSWIVDSENPPARFRIEMRGGHCGGCGERQLGHLSGWVGTWLDRVECAQAQWLFALGGSHVWRSLSPSWSSPQKSVSLIPLRTSCLECLFAITPFVDEANRKRRQGDRERGCPSNKFTQNPQPPTTIAVLPPLHRYVLLQMKVLRCSYLWFLHVWFKKSPKSGEQ